MVVCAYGTVFVTYFFRFMGAQVDGALWYFGNAIYDFHKLHFEDKAIVDDAHVSGHYVVYGTVTLKDTTLGGIVHPGAYCPAGSTLKDPESGPWKVYLLGDSKTINSGGVLDVDTSRVSEESEEEFEA